jgi:hypothetical protein
MVWHDSGCWCPGFHLGDPGSIARQSMCDLWWIKWHCAKFFPSNSVLLCQLLHRRSVLSFVVQGSYVQWVHLRPTYQGTSFHSTGRIIKEVHWNHLVGTFWPSSIHETVKQQEQYHVRRSQRPRGLRHETSSSALTLGSWGRIPLKVWMSVWVYSVFVLSCVGSGLASGWSPFQGVLPSV